MFGVLEFCRRLSGVLAALVNFSFFAKITYFRLILIKIMFLKCTNKENFQGIAISSAKT